MQGEKAMLNFSVDDYTDQFEELQATPFLELVSTLAANAVAHSREVRLTSRFKGVWLDKARQLWRTQLADRDLNVGPIYVGQYANEEDAAKAYDRAAIAFRSVQPVIFSSSCVCFSSCEQGVSFWQSGGIFLQPSMLMGHAHSCMSIMLTTVLPWPSGQCSQSYFHHQPLHVLLPNVDKVYYSGNLLASVPAASNAVESCPIGQP